jgi:chromosome segregation ATPase
MANIRMYVCAFQNIGMFVSDVLCVYSQARSFRKELDQRLEETLGSLNQVMNSNDQLLAERNHFQEMLRETIAEREELQQALEDMRIEAQLQQQDITRESAQLASEEYARLVERLELAEKRAVEMSSSGAKAFAKSARTIAYLEGECNHQASLVDHFRGVNAKLTSDLKIVHEEALRVKGLEHRLNMAHENEVALLGRIAAQENAIRSKEKELLLTLHSSQNQEEIRTEKFDSEIRDLSEKLKASKDKISALARELKSATETYESRIIGLQDDVAFGKEQLNRVEQEKARQQHKLDEVENASGLLKNSLRSAEDRIVELESQLHLLAQDKVLFGDAFEKRKIEFDSSIQDKSRRIRELENQSSALKKQLSDAEASNTLKDDVISSSLSKQSILADENRALRIRLDSLASENSNLLQSNENMRNQLSHLSEEHSSMKSSYSDLKGVTLPDTIDKLHSIEESFRSQSLELELLRSDHSKVKNELTSVVDRLSQSDRRNHTLQSNLAVAEGEIQAAQTNNASLIEENSKLRVQTEELAVRLTTMTKDLASIRVHLLERENEIELISNRLRDAEDAASLANEKNRAYELFESDIANEMRVFGDDIAAGAAGQLTARDSDISTYAIENDFFASPLPSASHGRHLTHTHGFQAIAKPASPKSTPKDSTTRNYPSTPTGLSALSLVRQGLEDLKVKSSALLQSNLRLKEQLAASKKEFAESKKRLEESEQQLRANALESERVVSQLESAEDQLSEARKELLKSSDERQQIYASADEFAQSIRSQVRNMDTAVADAVARVSAMLTGRVIYGSDEQPLIISFQPTSPPTKQHLKAQHKSTAVDFGASSVVATSVHEVERAFSFLCSTLDSVIFDASHKKQQADRADLSLIDKERSWGKERTQFFDKIAALEMDLENQLREKKAVEDECSNVAKQVESLKILLSEFSMQKEELESECRASMNNAESLQSALAEAEAVCLELRAKLRSSQADNETKLDELSAATTQLDLCRKRLAETDLTMEKLTASQARLKSEKDAMDGVRRSLEAELDRARNELSSLKLQYRASEEDGKSTFEVEKLLSALGTSLDQVHSSFASLSSSAGSAALVKASGEQENTLSTRVEQAVRRLGELRSWARDECRSRRNLEEKLETTEQDLQATNAANDSLQEQLKRVMQSVSEKSHECRDKMKEISELQSNVLRRQEELDKLRRELQSSQSTLDEEKKNRMKLLADMQLKDSELSKLAMELESANSALIRTNEQLLATKDRLTEVTAESEQRSEQLKSAKANNARLSSSLELLEKGFDRDRSDRGILDQKLLDNESHAASAIRLKSQVVELESALHVARDTLRTVTEAKDTAEHQLHVCQFELESLKSSLRSAESRLEQSQRERIALQEECHSNRIAVAKLSQQLDQEQANRLRAESNVEALKRTKSSRSDADYTAIMGDVEGKIFMGEEERNEMQNQNHSLKLRLDAKESSRIAEESRALKLEREIQLLKSKLNMTSQEIAASNTRAAALRTEGRRARTQVYLLCTIYPNQTETMLIIIE